MGDIALGMEFGRLKQGQKPVEVKKLQSTINVAAVGGTIPWLAPLVMDIPGFMSLINSFRQLLSFIVRGETAGMSRLCEFFGGTNPAFCRLCPKMNTQKISYLG